MTGIVITQSLIVLVSVLFGFGLGRAKPLSTEDDT